MLPSWRKIAKRLMLSHFAWLCSPSTRRPSSENVVSW